MLSILLMLSWNVPSEGLLECATARVPVKLKANNDFFLEAFNLGFKKLKNTLRYTFLYILHAYVLAKKIK